jgi:predicted double-glycine peptidase
MIYKMKFFTMVGGKMDDSCGLDASAVRMVVEFWGGQMTILPLRD